MSNRRVFVLCLMVIACAAILCASTSWAAPIKMSSGFYYPTERTWTGSSGGSTGDPRQPWNDGSPGGRIYGYLDSAAPSALGKQHVGMDIRTPYSGPVYAICAGTIYRYINTGDSRYWCIIVKHTLADGSTFYAVYGHCRLKSGYSSGKALAAGENFAQINESVNQHIHFGIKMNSDFGTGWGHLTIGVDANSIGWRPPKTWLYSHTPAGGSTTPPPTDGGGGTTPPPTNGGNLGTLIVTSGSKVFSDGFYAQKQDGTAGMHLKYGTSSGPTLVVGDTITVTSYSATTVNGEQVLGSAVVVDTGSTFEPDPLDVTVADMRDKASLDGLLVTITGKVGYRKSDASAFYLEDGSGIADAYHPGIRILCKGFANGSTISMPATGKTVTVVGICSRANVESKIVPCIRPRETADVTVQ